MQIEIEEFQRLFYEIKEETFKELDKSQHKQVELVLTAKISLLNKILIWLHNTKQEGSSDMEKLKREIQAETVKLKDIPERNRKSPVEDSLVTISREFMEELKQATKDKVSKEDLPAKKINGLSWGYFSSVVHRLHEKGHLDKTIVPMKRGDECYLVKK